MAALGAVISSLREDTVAEASNAIKPLLAAAAETGKEALAVGRGGGRGRGRGAGRGGGGGRGGRVRSHEDTGASTGSAKRASGGLLGDGGGGDVVAESDDVVDSGEYGDFDDEAYAALVQGAMGTGGYYSSALGGMDQLMVIHGDEHALAAATARERFIQEQEQAMLETAIRKSKEEAHRKPSS